MAVTVYHYPNCGTCKKARRWLDAQGIEHILIDIVTDTPDSVTLRSLHERSGLDIRKFFNTSGQSYRNGGWKDRMSTLSETAALAALAADGKLIKRPIVDAGDVVLVGFREEAYAKALSR